MIHPLTRMVLTSLLPGLPTAIKMDLNLFQSGHAFFDLFIDKGQKLLQFIPRVDYLDDDRQVLRQPLDLKSVQTAVSAKTHHPTHHRSAGQTFLSRFQHQPFVQKLAVMAVALADENAQQVTF
jgi:hypothetical protein